jgi:Domain of unknown function (DUF4062)/Protein kinase domain
MKINPLTIFISSTFADLTRYREVVHSAIRRLQNHAEDMIYWSADERQAAVASVDKVNQADLLILIVAHRYGSIPANDTRSFVELEYSAAREKGLPVLAFFIEPDYPWPPDYIDFDAEVRTKLTNFKRQVESDCVRQFFTTTESLAIGVTQAIANFDRRRSTPEESANIGRRINQEIIRPRTDLAHQVDLIVQIGTAEDGLPLGVRIGRSQDISRPINEISSRIKVNVEDEPLLTINKTLKDEGKKVWLEAGLHYLQLPDGSQPRCYVTYNNLSKFFVPSLVMRLLTAANRGRDAILKRHRYNDSSINTSQSMVTSLSARHGRDKRVQSSGGSNRFLAVSTDTDDIYVVGWRLSDDRRWMYLEFWRQFINESVLSLSEWSFELVESRSADTTRIVATGDSKTYREKVFRVLEKPKYSENISYVTKFRISRRSIAEMIIMAAERLKTSHLCGCIHGDIKPQNMLLSRDEIALIDSLNLQEGEIPPAVSPDWAAPEQLLMRPVSKATDIYPFGLMLCALIGGQLTGEYVQYVLPASNREELIVPLVRNPIIYLSPRDQKLILAGRKVWFDLIESCLAFNVSQRPKDADEFITGLRTVCDKYPLEGSIEIEVRPTLSPELAIFSDGSEQPCRIITDNWSSLQRPAIME